MLAAFQGFTTPHGGKKTRQDVQVINSERLIGVNPLEKLQAAASKARVDTDYI